MSKLHLKFLGRPEISYQGQELQFPTRKALALFVYLVVEKGTHSRDQTGLPSFGLRVKQNWVRRLYGIHWLACGVRYKQPNSPIVGRAGTLGFDFESAFELDLQLIDAALKSNQLRNIKGSQGYSSRRIFSWVFVGRCTCF